MNTSAQNELEVLKQKVQWSERVLENLSVENHSIKSSIVSITFDYVLGDLDVPDHIKKNVRVLRELYIVTESVGKTYKSDFYGS